MSVAGYAVSPSGRGVGPRCSAVFVPLAIGGLGTSVMVSTAANGVRRVGVEPGWPFGGRPKPQHIWSLWQTGRRPCAHTMEVRS